MTGYEEAIFGPLAPERTCGECVACCKILVINHPNLRKEADCLCPHNVGSGCGIYETRPTVCRNWHCLWRHLADMPDGLRPDRSGMMVSLEGHRPPRTIFENLYVVIRAIDGPEVFDTPIGQELIASFARMEVLPVWISWAGKKFLVHPDQALADAIVNPNTAHKELIAEGRAWRARYPFS